MNTPTPAKHDAVLQVQKVSATVGVPTATSADVVATCPAGFVPVGGGYQQSDSGIFSVLSSRPTDAGDGWVVSVHNNNDPDGSQPPVDFTVFVLCVAGTITDA